MDNFFSLNVSQILNDRLKFLIFVELLKDIYGVDKIEKEKTYRYTTKLETEENRQKILDNWYALFFFETQKDYSRKNKRLVYWTINRMVEIFNRDYCFNHLITFDHVMINIKTENDKPTTLTYYDLKFG